MILSPERRKIATNKSMRNVLSDPIVCGLSSVNRNGTSGPRSCEKHQSVPETLIFPRKPDLFPSIQRSHPTAPPSAQSVNDPEQLSKNTAQLATNTVNEWSTILKNIQHSPPVPSTSSSRLQKKKRRDSDVSDVVDELKYEVHKVSGEAGIDQRSDHTQPSFRPITRNIEEADPSVSSQQSLSPRISSALASSIPPSPALEIIPISLQDTMSDKYTTPVDTPYLPHRREQVDESRCSISDEEYGSGYGSIDRLSSGSNWSLSPERKILHHNIDGRPLHSDSSLEKDPSNKFPQQSSSSIQQSRYNSLSRSLSSTNPNESVPVRRISDYKPNILLANVLSLPDNITNHNSSCCLPFCFTKGNVVHVVEEPLGDSLSSPNLPARQKPRSWISNWIRRSNSSLRSNSYNYTMAALRSSVYPDNSGVDI